MGVELHAGVLTVVQVVASPDFALAAGAKELRVRGRGGAATLMQGERLPVLRID
jgi:ketosteroid isomerase-like protein